MKIDLRKMLIGTLLLVAVGSRADAAISGDTPTFSLMGGAHLFDGQDKLRLGPSVGARVGYDVSDRFGLEGSVMFIPAVGIQTRKNADCFLVGVDTLFYLLPEKRFVPYFLAGIGFMQGKDLPKTNSFPATTETRTSAIIDAGVGAKVFLTDSLAFRWDTRALGVFDAGRRINAESTVGLTYHFGAPKKGATVARLPEPNPPKAAATLSEPLAPKPVPVEPAPAPKPLHPPAPPVEKETAVPAAPSAPVISNIIGKANWIELLSSTNINDYKAFTLRDPARLVIDIPGASSTLKDNMVIIHSTMVEDVRVGKYPDHVRVVIDMVGNSVPAYQFLKAGTGLKIVFSLPTN